MSPAGIVAACGSNSPTPSSNRLPSADAIRRAFDRDGDGIFDVLDRRPDINDGPDLDGDGIPNASDADPYVYGEAPVAVVLPSLSSQPAPYGVLQPAPPPGFPSTTSPSRTTATTLPCSPGMGSDADRDGLPDHCDPYYDWRDSDGDGLDDKDDAAPYTADRDNDGLPDGWDRKPDYSRYVEQRREQARRDAQRRDEERRQAERDERRRQEREYQNRRWQRYP